MSKISEQRRSDILRAAQAEFLTRGVEGASMSEIAARAGIGKSTIYEYFSSKIELFTAATKLRIQEFEQQIQSIFEQDGPFTDQIRSYFEGAATWMGDLNLDTIIRMFLNNTSSEHPMSFLELHKSVAGELPLSFMEMQDNATGVIEGAIRKAQAAGELASDLDVSAAAVYLLALPNPFLVGRLRELGRKNPADLLVDLTIHGIKPRPSV